MKTVHLVLAFFLLTWVFCESKTGFTSKADNRVEFYPLDWAEVEDSFLLQNDTFFGQSGDSKERRSISYEDPELIPFGTQQVNEGDIGNAYRFLFRNMDRKQGRFVFYPYSFSVNNDYVNNVFSQGAVIPYNISSSVAKEGEEGFFLHFLDYEDLDLTRAQVLYDSSIAILQMEEDGVPVSTSSLSTAPGNFLTIEGYSYCYPLYNYIGEKYTQCWQSDLYQTYLAKNPSFENSSVVYVNEKDIQNGFLFHSSGVTMRFGVLIIPSIYDGTESTIAELLGSTGVAQIRAFVEQGGLVFASGKGNLVLQEIGLAEAGTFDPNQLLLAEDLTANVIGCEPSTFSPPSSSELTDSDFIRRTLCFGIPEDSRGFQSDSLSSAPIVKDHSGFTVTSYWNPRTSSLILKERKTGLTEDIATDSSLSLPHTMYKRVGKGFVVSHLGNPMKRSVHFPWFYNALFLAWTKPLLLDMGLTGNFTIIPGLEQTAFATKVNLQNFYTEALTDIHFHVWIMAGFEIRAPYPSHCRRVMLSTPELRAQYPFPADTASILSTDYVFDCAHSISTVSPFQTLVNTFKVYVSDVSVTQKGEGIAVLHPVVNYTIPSRSETVHVDYGPLLVNSYMAAVLRADVNADPMGDYPLRGEGTPTDNVVWAENKEETPAYDVHLVNVLPLFTPVVDNSNQAELATIMDFDHRFYLKEVNGIADYKYPFDTVGNKDVRDVDYLDWRLLGLRHNHMAADWDTPVKMYEVMRDATPFETDHYAGLKHVDVAAIPNSNYQTAVENDEIVLKEAYFADADNFYESAAQRLLAFVDATTEEGFATYNHSSRWIDGIASSRELYIDPETGVITKKKQIIIARTDMYFYMINGAPRYPMPKGMRDDQANYYFSLDKYSEVKACDPSARFQSLIPKSADREGYFSSKKVDGYYPPGHKPTQCRSRLYQDCNRRQSNPETDFDGDDIQLTHYLVRLDENNITSGNQVLDFVRKDDYWVYDPDDALPVAERHYGRYDEIRIQSVMAADFAVSSASSRRGGQIIITLPSGVNLGTHAVTDVVHYAADQIAVLGTTYDPDSNSLYTYFKRGNMPNENYGQDSSLQVNIDSLVFTDPSLKHGFTASVNIYPLTYDLSETTTAKYRADYYESYSKTASASLTVKFAPLMALRLPAVRLQFHLARGEGKNESYIEGYEYLRPFARYGVYVQDVKRRDVYGATEVHLNDYHGAVSPNLGFAWMTNIGISSIPFREFLNTGSKVMIPASLDTSRVEWKDMWGRRFSQPIRSLFFDVPPIPPPIRNYMMTTTYELLEPDTGKRMLEWTSDQPAQVHVQVKFYNNYPKHFEITSCQANALVQKNVAKVRVFDTDLNNMHNCTDFESKTQFLNMGNTAWYGSCLQTLPVTLSNTTVTPTVASQIQQVRACSSSEDWYEGCTFLDDGLPTISKAAGKKTMSDWNYISQVEAFYPENYIKPNMWSLQHYDYDDNDFDKAYKYHCDNRLPNIDTILGEDLLRPQNLFAFPIYRGLGYHMAYDKRATIPDPRFAGLRGWWSDQLQNRDHTLLAGQSKSNDVAVGAADLTDELGWIDIADLDVLSAKDLATVKGNIYTCLFNRHRVKVDPKAPKKFFLQNVVENNVVPVENSLSKDDARLTKFNCGDVFYSPKNISQYDNLLETETARDWMYFAVNLRGNAKENMHVVYSLQPMSTKVEGEVKVQDGGRYVYWNPVLGPNAYLTVDGGSDVVNAVRTDLTLSQEIFPSSTTTFNGLVFSLMKIEDERENMREYTDRAYTNHYGFGDASTTVHVGSEGTRSYVYPGGHTIVQIQLINNAGFNWNLYDTAMNSTELESVAINGYQLLYNIKQTLQRVDSYNFFTLDVPPELGPHVEITPSDHVIGISPMFFDFQEINIATIRDGFQGTYYYKIKLLSSAYENESLFGKLHHIGVRLNYEYFDRLPGYNDPAPPHYHDYTLTIPDIVFGIPYPSTHKQYPNKIFHTSGYASDLTAELTVPSTFSVDGVKYITGQDVEELREAAANEIGRIARLEALWDSFAHVAAYTADAVDYTYAGLLDNVTTTAKTVAVDYSVAPPTVTPATNTLNLSLIARPHCSVPEQCNSFPFPISQGPDKAEVYVLVKLSADQLAYGSNYAVYSTAATFTSPDGRAKTETIATPFTVGARGAWLEVEYSGELQTLKGDKLYDQKLRATDGGIVQTEVTVMNRGNDDAFNVEMTVILPLDVAVLKEELDDEYTLVNRSQSGKTAQILTLHTNEAVPGGESLTKVIPLQFMPCTTHPDADTVHYSCLSAAGSTPAASTARRDAEGSGGSGSGSGSGGEGGGEEFRWRQLLLGCVGTIDLTETKNERRVSQRIDTAFHVALSQTNRPLVTLATYQHRVPGAIKLSLVTNTTDMPEGVPVQYRIFRQNVRGTDYYCGNSTTPYAAKWVLESVSEDPVFFTKIADDNGNNDLEVRFYADVVVNQTELVLGESEPVTYSHGPEWWIWLLTALGVTGCGCALGSVLWMRHRGKTVRLPWSKKWVGGRVPQPDSDFGDLEGDVEMAAAAKPLGQRRALPTAPEVLALTPINPSAPTDFDAVGISSLNETETFSAKKSRKNLPIPPPQAAAAEPANPFGDETVEVDNPVQSANPFDNTLSNEEWMRRELN